MNSLTMVLAAGIVLMGMTVTAAEKSETKVATFGGGCFWCLEAGFERFEGVGDVISGYAGGATVNPTYKQVCSGSTGHAEVVQVPYDPKKISYDQLLQIFWEIHDPTTLNKQGADVGTEYRSVVFYHDEEQQAAAKKAIATVAGKYKDPVVTELLPLEKFYPAEDYHQDFFTNNQNYP